MSGQVFLIIDVQTKGPFSPQQIRDGLKSGMINRKPWLQSGINQWKPVAEVLQDIRQGLVHRAAPSVSSGSKRPITDARCA